MLDISNIVVEKACGYLKAELISKTFSELKQLILSYEQVEHIDNLQDWTDKYQSPLQHLEHKLHSWVAYFITLVFALANAGVVISGDISIETALVTNI